VDEIEKQKKLDQFREVTKKIEVEKNKDVWTEEDIREAANRIAERLGLNVRW